MKLDATLIGSAEAARIMGVDRASFNKWVTRGDIVETFRFPGATGPRLFRRADIEARAAARADRRTGFVA